MLLHDFWFEYHQKWVCPWRWYNCTFCIRTFSFRNNNWFLLDLQFRLKQLCKKIANKLNGFTKTEPCLSRNQRQLIYSFFFYWTIKLLPINMDLLLQIIKSSYKQTPKKALGIVYNDYDSSFSKLLEMSNESASHIKSIKVFMTEVYKFLIDLSPSIINDIFQKTRKLSLYKKPKVPSSKWKFTTTYGIDTISFRRPQIWQDRPQVIENSDSLNFFKSNINRAKLHFLCSGFKTANQQLWKRLYLSDR